MGSNALWGNGARHCAKQGAMQQRKLRRNEIGGKSRLLAHYLQNRLPREDSVHFVARNLQDVAHRQRAVAMLPYAKRVCTFSSEETYA